MTEERLHLDIKHPNRCPYCHDEVRPDQAKTACEGCMAWHHKECWESHQGACSACGRGALDAPPAAPSSSLTDRADRLGAALEVAKSELAQGTPRTCTTAFCAHPRWGRRSLCAWHLRKEGKIWALVGSVNFLLWSVLLAALGAGPRDDIFVGVVFGALGLLMGLYGLAILRAASRQGAPS